MDPQTTSVSEQPIFVRVDEYQDVLDLLTLIRQRLGKAQSLLENLQKIKQEEEMELGEWGRSVADIDRRVEEIDKLLFKADRR